VKEYAHYDVTHAAQDRCVHGFVPTGVTNTTDASVQYAANTAR